MLGDARFRTGLLLDSSRDEPVTVVVDGIPYTLGPRGAKVVEVAESVLVSGRPVDLSPLSRRAEAALIRVRAGLPCRWSVMGANGQGWYPRGAPPKRDAHRRPYFHGDDLVVEVPAEEPVTVSVARGMEYTTAEIVLTPEAGAPTLVELTPERLYDAAARGWYGGDLHVHLNWMGEEPARPPWPPRRSTVRTCTCSTSWRATSPVSGSTTWRRWSTGRARTCRGPTTGTWPGSASSTATT
ncbi:hypothetical protein ACFQ0B_21150 [Nonomuraea thailandensis]